MCRIIERLVDVLPHLIWAGLAFWLLGYRFRTAFEKILNAIELLFGRIKRLGVGSATVDLADDQVRAPPIPPPASNTASSTSSTAAPQVQEPVRRAIIEEYRARLQRVAGDDAVQREAALLFSAADWYVKYTHERAYRFIFGSQISLLLALRDGLRSHSRAELEPLFDQAKKAFPAIHETRTFEVWMLFLIRAQLAREDSPGQYSITDAGTDFLKYLVDSGYTSYREG